MNDATTKERISAAVETAKCATEFCRDLPNCRIAHRDLKLAIAEGAKPLPAVSRAMVKQALESIAAVLNVVTEHYTDSTTRFDMPGADGGASLIYVIDDGLKAATQREERIRQDKWNKEDIERRDI